MKKNYVKLKKRTESTPTMTWKESAASVTDYRENETDPDLSTCSTTDCTGLIPAGITDEEEVEHYTQLYPYLPKAD